MTGSLISKSYWGDLKVLVDKCGLNDSGREIISDFWEEEWKGHTCDLRIGISMKTRLQVEASSLIGKSLLKSDTKCICLVAQTK